MSNQKQFNKSVSYPTNITGKMNGRGTSIIASFRISDIAHTVAETTLNVLAANDLFIRQPDEDRKLILSNYHRYIATLLFESLEHITSNSKELKRKDLTGAVVLTEWYDTWVGIGQGDIKEKATIVRLDYSTPDDFEEKWLMSKHEFMDFTTIMKKYLTYKEFTQGLPLLYSNDDIDGDKFLGGVFDNEVYSSGLIKASSLKFIAFNGPTLSSGFQSTSRFHISENILLDTHWGDIFTVKSAYNIKLG